jgi:hypothetical protein
MEETLHSKSANQAINAYEKFITALNSGDSQAMFEVMHVPHIRISGNGVVIYETKGQLKREYLNGFESRAGQTWHHTETNWVQALHSSNDKVHLYLQWTRYDKGGNSLATHCALWIMTKLDGKWGAQCRSSFAP